MTDKRRKGGLTPAKKTHKKKKTAVGEPGGCLWPTAWRGGKLEHQLVRPQKKKSGYRGKRDSGRPGKQDTHQMYIKKSKKHLSQKSPLEGKKDLTAKTL